MAAMFPPKDSNTNFAVENVQVNVHLIVGLAIGQTFESGESSLITLLLLQMFGPWVQAGSFVPISAGRGCW